jgi:hypothetical protein
VLIINGIATQTTAALPEKDEFLPADATKRMIMLIIIDLTEFKDYKKPIAASGCHFATLQVRKRKRSATILGHSLLLTNSM